MGTRRRLALAAGAVGIGAIAAARPALNLAADVVEGRLNGVHPHDGGPVSERALELHASLRIADLHADSLLWGRDLLVRGRRGHLDVPRMLEGNVALATLAAAVKTSRHMNIDENPDRGDDVRLIAMARRWPRETWSSLLARTLHFATRARAFAAASGGTFRIVETREDLAAFLAARTTNPGLAAAILSIEGAHALDDDAANVEVVADAGFRMISPAHFFDTAFGGSAHGVRKHGLTDAGREMIRRMEARGVILDVAHASETAIDDALAIATRPVVASHTGLRGVIDNRRNLPDAQLEGIAATGGVVGIGFWDTVTGGTDAASIARSIAYAVERVGADHVALGSDWDGAVAVPFDAAGTGRLTEALLDVGLDEPAIRAVMGESALRVFAEVLPTGELPAAG